MINIYGLIWKDVNDIISVKKPCKLEDNMIPFGDRERAMYTHTHAHTHTLKVFESICTKLRGELGIKGRYYLFYILTCFKFFHNEHVLFLHYFLKDKNTKKYRIKGRKDL